MNNNWGNNNNEWYTNPNANLDGFGGGGGGMMGNDFMNDYNKSFHNNNNNSVLDNEDWYAYQQQYNEMRNLPPTCTSVTSSSHNSSSISSSGNALALVIKGLNSLKGQEPIEIPYPAGTDFAERPLPVCERCKRNFKTRDVCRKKYQHRALPWCPVFLCITLDHSCTSLLLRMMMRITMIAMVTILKKKKMGKVK